MFRKLPWGAVKGFGPLCWDANDPAVIAHGVGCRLLRTLPKANCREYKKFVRFVHRFLDKMNLHELKPLDFEEWLESTGYDENRKNQLRAARNDLRGKNRMSKKQRRKVLLFVKHESYTAYKASRGIYSRNDYFKAWAGPFVKAIERVVYEWVDEEGDNYFIKHIPVPERPKFIRKFERAGWKYYSNDFTAYESHFTHRFIKDVEGALYRRCFPRWGTLYTNALAGKNMLATRDRRVSVKTKAHRMSGEMSTSLGNGFTNLMLGLYLAEEMKTHIKIVVEGDDSLIASSMDFTPSMFERLGFTIKIEQVERPGDASFCGMLCSDEGEVIKDPIKFFSNFGWSRSMINAGRKVNMSLLRAKALSACYEAPNCPIIGVLAREALKRTRGVRARFIKDGYHQYNLSDEMPIPVFAPSLSTRQMFSDNFGVSISQQYIIEDWISHDRLDLICSIIHPPSDISDYVSKYLIIDGKIDK